MTADVQIFRNLHFDLDTQRPFFYDQSAKDEYFGLEATKIDVHTSNFNKIGDDMLVSEDLDTICTHNVGRLRLKPTGRWWYFRITDMYVNETNRTRIVYEIDYELTFMGSFRSYSNIAARILRCPKGNEYAVGVPIEPRFYQYGGIDQIKAGVAIALTLKQMKSEGSTSYDVAGPVFVMIRCRWQTFSQGFIVPYDPIAEFLSLGRCVASDIVNAWLVPEWFVMTATEQTGNLRWWTPLTIGSGHTSLYAIRYTHGSSLASIDGTITIPNVDKLKTSSADGRIMGFCDERGNILYTVPDMLELSPQIDFGIRMSMTVCEVDINMHSTGYIAGHLTNRMFTYSCRPLDVICDSWAEYAFRQRAADIEGRRIQNNEALTNAGASALTGAATGAMMGSVVPGIGTAAGAAVGAIGGLVMAGVSYGSATYYGNRQQELVDRTFKLAQDNVAVTGAVTCNATASGQLLFVFTLMADDTTLYDLAVEAALFGVNASGVTDDMGYVLRNAVERSPVPPAVLTVSPFAFVPILDTFSGAEALPKAWKDKIVETCSKGAVYTRAGSWPTV